MDPIERVVSRVLGVGIAAAVVLMLSGLVLGVAKGEGVPPRRASGGLRVRAGGA
jgi:hypothetical protein